MFRRTVAVLNHSSPRQTKLACGVNVVTFNELSPVSCIGVINQIGSRYESPKYRGCARILEKMAYGVEPVWEPQVAGQVSVTNHRETMIYRTDCLRWDAESAFQLLMKMGVAPEVNEKTVEAGKALALSNIDHMRREPMKILFELLHQSGWKDNSLGNVGFDPDDTFESVTPDLLLEYLDMFVQPERLTVIARGVEHEAMLEIAGKELESHFKSHQRAAIPEELLQPAKYTGGVTTMQNLTAPSSFQKFYEKNNTHIGLMFEGVPLGHEDYYVMVVTQSFLGGGMSFSAGGPGKGIMTKLYRDSLCRHGWLDGIESISAAYADTGALGIYGQAEHQHSQKLRNELVRQLTSIADGLTAEEVQLAKNQFLSQNLMSLEERGASIDDLGRYVSVTGRLPDTEELKAGVEAVTVQRIRDFVAPRIRGNLIYGIYGNVEGIDSLEEVHSLVARRLSGGGGGSNWLGKLF